MGDGDIAISAPGPGSISDIYVRAVNNAGNAIVVKVPARHPASPWRVAWEVLLAATLGALVIAAAWLLRRRVHDMRRS